LTHVWFEHATAVPQLPVASHVCTPLVVVEHCVAPGVQTPVQAPLAQAWLLQGAAVPHDPLALHVWTASPEHCVAPGLQATHAPPRHTGAPLEHASAAPHWPEELQVCTPPPDPPSAPHWVDPGVQTPVHAPPLHTYWQLDAGPQVPFAVHVSTPFPAHWVAPTEQADTHAPAVHTFAQGMPMFCHAPVASQVCGCCPLH
jgi:hypothetical protein